MSLIPIKFRVVEIILHNAGISDQEILKMLKEDYPLDRGVNENNVDSYLLSLKAVGLIDPTRVAVDKDGKLQQCYNITEYGRKRMKYIS
ncbi:MULTISPECIES: hypothetical protein [Desulfitobacterium]|uniref:DUF4364 family protein n=1 Tax=Desulfitobacterium dehalogenans (strain ATCC 51507 / DSM 9161 / JW/IU-DC1) TaxID=756499 RepID=I4AET2_DESDJ|nr:MULTISPECIES: hypothetical protein [Desulfitobacterium]AFM02467.1 hypothetical protein Desde_4206 [Desulfitobacterium dehalogenans ATCC 51507]